MSADTFMELGRRIRRAARAEAQDVASPTSRWKVVSTSPLRLVNEGGDELEDGDEDFEPGAIADAEKGDVVLCAVDEDGDYVGLGVLTSTGGGSALKALKARVTALEERSRWYVDNSAVNVDNTTTRGVWQSHGDSVSGIVTVAGDLIAVRFSCLWFCDDPGNGGGQVRVTVDGTDVKFWKVNQLQPQPATGTLSQASTGGKINALATTANGWVIAGGSGASNDPSFENTPMTLGADLSGDPSNQKAAGTPMVVRVAPGTHTVRVEFYAGLSPAGNYHLRKRRLWVERIRGNG